MLLNAQTPHVLEAALMSALAVPARDAEPTSHRQVLEALSGLLLVLFVAMLSSTVVATALPQSIGALRGSQTQYTWVVTATLLTATATTPVWGKLADLFNKKLLIQVAIVIFVAGSAIAGLSHNAAELSAAGVSLLLIWVSFVDSAFAWLPWPTYAMGGGSLLLLALAVLVESRAAEPVVPLSIVRDRTTA